MNSNHKSPNERGEQDSGPGRRVTRRNLAAAAAVLAAGLASRAQNAKAMGWPWIIDRGRGKGGRQHPCFLSGTQVLTPAGEIEVEKLRDGDLVTTQSGEFRPIKRMTTTVLHRPETGTWDRSKLPVRVQRGALGPNAPHRDLYLSQSHSVLLEGALYTIGSLENGSTVAVVDGSEFEKIVYFHIETDAHDVVMAQGAPCETLLDVEASAAMATAAPLFAQSSARGARLKSRLRSAASPLIDLRNEADKMRDKLEDRAEFLKAA